MSLLERNAAGFHYRVTYWPLNITSESSTLESSSPSVRRLYDWTASELVVDGQRTFQPFLIQLLEMSTFVYHTYSSRSSSTFRRSTTRARHRRASSKNESDTLARTVRRQPLKLKTALHRGSRSDRPRYNDNHATISNAPKHGKHYKGADASDDETVVSVYIHSSSERRLYASLER